MNFSVVLQSDLSITPVNAGCCYQCTTNRINLIAHFSRKEILKFPEESVECYRKKWKRGVTPVERNIVLNNINTFFRSGTLCSAITPSCNYTPAQKFLNLPSLK